MCGVWSQNFFNFIQRLGASHGSMCPLHSAGASNRSSLANSLQRLHKNLCAADSERSGKSLLDETIFGRKKIYMLCRRLLVSSPTLGWQQQQRDAARGRIYISRIINRKLGLNLWRQLSRLFCTAPALISRAWGFLLPRVTFRWLYQVITYKHYKQLEWPKTCFCADNLKPSDAWVITRDDLRTILCPS